MLDSQSRKYWLCYSQIGAIQHQLCTRELSVYVIVGCSTIQTENDIECVHHV